MWALLAPPKEERQKKRRRGRTTAVWREQALSEIAARRFSLDRLSEIDGERRKEIQACLDHATKAATDSGLSWRRRQSSTWRGASIERTWGRIDAADEALLQVAPEGFVIGQLPRIRRRAQQALAADDARRIEIEEIALRHLDGAPAAESRELLGTVVPRICDADLSDHERAKFLAAITPCKTERVLTQGERESLAATFHAANCAARKKQTRVRSFRNLLLSCALVLAIAALGLAALGMLRPAAVPICFHPDSRIVCPTGIETLYGEADASGQPDETLTAAEQAMMDRIDRRTAQPIDLALVELMGLIGAALASATTLRRMSGTSTPYAVPFALAVIKLPTGALTAALGLLLMRGEFVPGLSALDSPAQIVAWAIVFGYSQQLFTRFVDQRGQTVLDSAGNASPREGSEPVPRGAVAATA
jgi:hypothetical protein